MLSASGEAGADTFTTMRQPEEFKKRVLELKIKTETAPSAVAAAALGAASGNGAGPSHAAASASEVLTTLAILASIRDAGTISSDEFETKKAELLARI